MMINLVGLWCNLSRAVEIAKTGNHSVSIYFSPDYSSGIRDYKFIKKFYKGFFNDFKKDGNIKIEICKPIVNSSVNRCETLTDIQRRIDKSLLNSKPELNLDSASDSLLKTAITRLNLSLEQIESILSTAQTIAQIDCKSIKAEHIAEAIQYSYMWDTCINAEDSIIEFGSQISIKLGDINMNDIDSAIEYLTKLKG